jgi:hypothetical protein
MTTLATPEATPAFDFSGMTPGEIEQRRDTLQAEILAAGGYDAMDVPIRLLEEFAYLTQALRRKNAGPPKARTTAARATKAAAKSASIDDLLDL